MNRAERRHQTARIKARTKAKMTRWLGLTAVTPRTVGINAAMHMTCGCWMCTAPVKWSKPAMAHIDDWSLE